MTDAETILWSYLRRGQVAGARFRRQHPIGPYVADFACAPAKLVIEVDGATHVKPDEIAHDRERTSFMEQRGWMVVRFNNVDVYENLDGVLETIHVTLINSLRSLDPSFAPLPAGELSAKLTEGGASAARPPSDGRSAATSPAGGGGKPNAERTDTFQGEHP